MFVSKFLTDLSLNDKTISILKMKKIEDAKFETIIDNIKKVKHTAPLIADGIWQSKYYSEIDETEFIKIEPEKPKGIQVIFNPEKAQDVNYFIENKNDLLSKLEDPNIVLNFYTNFKTISGFKNSLNDLIDNNESYMNYLCSFITTFTDENGDVINLTSSMRSRLALKEFLTKEEFMSDGRKLNYLKVGDKEIPVREYIESKLLYMNTNAISDMSIAVNSPLCFRINKELVPFDTDKLDLHSVRAIEEFFLDSSKGAFKQEMYRKVGYTRIAYPFWGVGRYRVTMGKQRGSSHLSVRALPETIRSLNDYHLTDKIKSNLKSKKGGIILIAGPPNSGKSSLAARVIQDFLNVGGLKIVSGENPIEFAFKHTNGMIIQVEIGEDIRDYEDFMTMIVTLDPDIIYITEIRNYEEVAIAAKQAAMGKLVIATTHGATVTESLSRLETLVPVEERATLIRTLYTCLKTVIVQHLVPRLGGGLVTAHEILNVNDSLKNTLKELGSSALNNSMTTILDTESEGNKRLAVDLFNLYLADLVSEETIKELVPTFSSNDKTMPVFRGVNAIDKSKYI